MMDKELVLSAISSAINLLSDELETITHDDLITEFEQTIEQLSAALIEIKCFQNEMD